MKRIPALFSILAATTLLAAPSAALQGPDVVISLLGVDGGNANDFVYYGQSGGIAAYSFATTSCNIGNQTLRWESSTLNHPVIGQNIFRLKGGRFEQLGQSWLKHGFCAVNENSCGSCQSTPCSTLGIGCADTYWGSLNDGASGGAKWPVNPATGSHIHSGGSPAGPTAIRGRLQIPVDDVAPAQNAGARYFAEGQYVTADDSAAGNHKNNASWREIAFPSVSGISQASPTTHVGQPGIMAWKAVDPAVTIVELMVPDEGGAGVHGWYFLGYRVRDNGDGTWSYNYSLQNLTSDRAIRTFRLPLSSGAQISGVHFRGVTYHSGEIHGNTPWTYSEGGAEFGWATETQAQNANASALRWGTLYAFGFEATSGPVGGTALMDLFKVGSPSLLSAPVLVPGVGIPSVGFAYCFGDGSGASCPCINFGELGRGCENQTFADGARLRAFGSASIGANDLFLTVDKSTPGAPGLFYQGNNAINGGLGTPYGDGLRCAGGGVVRVQVQMADAQGDATSSVSIPTVGGANAGDTRRYQWWYRDPGSSPCNQLFNLTNGIEVTYTP